MEGTKIPAIGSLILLPFLIATLLMHIWVSELNKFHRKLIISYLIALLVTDLSSIAGGFNIRREDFISFAIYLLSFSTFLWLNVICFDLCIQVRNVKRFRRFSERARFILYSFYAWCTPVLVFGIVAILNEFLKFLYRAKAVNVKRAFLFSIPIIIIFGLNAILYKCSEQLEMNDGLMDGEGTEEELNQRNEVFKFHLYFFIVIGLAWGIDAFATLFLSHDYFLLPLEISNIVQGAVIFKWTISRPIIQQSLQKKFIVVVSVTV